MSGAAALAAGRRWRVTVSPTCLGSGLCVATAPGCFRLVGGRSRPTADETAPDERIVAAAQLCPVGAIAVRDADSGLPIDAPDAGSGSPVDAPDAGRPRRSP